MGSTIIGCGKSLPKLEVANDELKALVDTNDEWISTRTGIRSRHVAVEETATDLAEAAARQALVIPYAAGPMAYRPTNPDTKSY